MKLPRNFYTNSRLSLLLCAIISVLLLSSCGKHDPFPLDEYENGHELSPPTGISVTPGGKGAGGSVSITWNLSKDDRYGNGSIIYKPDSSDAVLDFDSIKYVIEKPSDKPINIRQVRYEVFRAVVPAGVSVDKLTKKDFVKVGEVEEGVGQFDDNPIRGLNNALSWYTEKKVKIKNASRDAAMIRNEKGYEVLEDTEKGKYLLRRFQELHPGYGGDGDIDNPNYYLMAKSGYGNMVPRTKTKEIGVKANEYWKKKYFAKNYVEDAATSNKSQWVLYRGEMIVMFLRKAISVETQNALKEFKKDQWLVDVRATESTDFKKYILRQYNPETSSYSREKELEIKLATMSDEQYEEYKKALKKQILLGWEVVKSNDDGVWFRMQTVIRREYESTQEDHIVKLAGGWEYDPAAKEYKRKKHTAQLTLCGLVNDKAEEEQVKYLNGDEARFEKYFENIRANLKKYVDMTDAEIDEIYQQKFDITKWEKDNIWSTDRHYILKRGEHKRKVTRKVEMKPYELPIEIARMKSRGYVVDEGSLQATNPSANIPEALAKALEAEGVKYNVAPDGRVYVPFVKKSEYKELFKSNHFLAEETAKLLLDGWMLVDKTSDERKVAFRKPFKTKPEDDAKFDTTKLEAEKEYGEVEAAHRKARTSPYIPVKGRSKEDEKLRYVLYHPKDIQKAFRSWQDVDEKLEKKKDIGQKVAEKVEDRLRRGMMYRGSNPQGHLYYNSECERNLIKQGTMYVYRVEFVHDVDRDGENLRRAPSQVTTPIMPYANVFDSDRIFVLIITIIFIATVSYFIVAAKRGKDFYIRPIAGISAVEEAVGRAAETGKTVMYLPGIGSIADIATLASLAILSRISEKAATYDTGIISPNYDPIVLQVAQEVIKESYMKAGRPDAYRDDMAFFLSQRQFAYAAGVSGLIAREKPATIFLMGVFFAESLLLAEAGNTVGALQIAGTDRDHQLPFFVTACDYTLIGEELYAAGAYLSRDPKLLGSLKGQDWFKAFCVIMTGVLLLGALLFQITGMLDIYWVFKELFGARFASPF